MLQKGSATDATEGKLHQHAELRHGPDSNQGPGDEAAGT